jgi:hypothetical protein
MRLFELKELVDKLYEDEANHNLKIIASCGFDDLSYSGVATSCEIAFQQDDGSCFTEDLYEEGEEIEGEKVIVIAGWQGD